MAGSVILAVAGWLAAAPYNFIGVLLFVAGLLATVLCVVGFIWPEETGCSVDSSEIKWWTNRLKVRTHAVNLSDVQSATRADGDSSWIELVTCDGTRYMISDSQTGGSDRIFSVLESRLRAVD